ncbi:MAG: 3'(2'),5'-bisphosphate nucleotidase CysQ [Alphaproteobacteria bacterium]|nr:3'(2'),5'-bisphosphate nucleotidase CysQ [Alphaproteobacteria bacterium]
MPAAENSADLDLLTRAAREAGAIAKAAFGSKPKTWEKSKGNPVTEVDLAVNLKLHELLLGARNDYGWLSEESADDPNRLSKQRVFVIDPIDGTLAFIKNKPEFTVCAAVVDNGRPVAAVIFNPMTDELFAAVQGARATLNGKPISVSSTAKLEGARTLVAKDVIRHPAWPRPWPEMTVENRASIAYRMALVACGTFDSMLSFSSKHEWDIVAGDLIVREAGGLVTSHTGAELRYNQPIPHLRSVICAGPAMHEAILERTRDIKLP